MFKLRDRCSGGRASPRVSIASRRISTSGWLCASSSRARRSALVLEVAQRFHGLALDVAVSVLPGNRRQGVGRRRLGPRAQRLDGLPTRVRIGQRPRQRDQRRRRFGQREIAERFSGFLTDV